MKQEMGNVMAVISAHGTRSCLLQLAFTDGMNHGPFWGFQYGAGVW